MVDLTIVRSWQPRKLEWEPGDGSDFDEQGGYLVWLERYARDQDIRQAIASAKSGDTEISWFDYDWSLNSQTAPGESAGHASSHSDFGSGSIPIE